MYLAPLNYDRFFERVFRDLFIAKQFLEDFLNVVIDEIEYLPRKNKIIDDGSFVEFDFRCKINGQYLVVDMQQWYKSDVVKRFYMYFCNNTSLQLERIPDLSIPVAFDKEYKTKYYDYVEPSITIIWMADDTLGFNEDIVSFSLFPEQLNEFIRNEELWLLGNEAELVEKRKKVLEILNNKSKKLDFLPKNRLIFAFQTNIVKNKSLEKYHWWFDFAAATKYPNNKKADFISFLDKPVFVKIMEKIAFKISKQMIFNT